MALSHRAFVMGLRNFRKTAAHFPDHAPPYGGFLFDFFLAPKLLSATPVE
jgi:hypothetical protein